MEKWAQVMALVAMGAAVLAVLVHLMFAIGVAVDAREREQAGQRAALAGSVTWFLATLLGGVFVAGIYWVMHHSTLSPRDEV